MKGIEIRKPFNDKKEYKFVTLPNRIKTLLVCDEKAKFSGACMRVNAGSHHSPKHLPGLPHFCEHMVLLASEKYPEESHYKKFVRSNGGQSNASTSSRETKYHFTIKNEKFEECLDIFANVFISPMMSENAISREINAVDSEFTNNFLQNSRRIFHFTKMISNEKNHYHIFSTGNKESLLSPFLSSPSPPLPSSSLSSSPSLSDTPSSSSSSSSPSLSDGVVISDGVDGVDGVVMSAGKGAGELSGEYAGLREELMVFHKQYYYSSNMFLVLLGSQPMKELEEIARKTFSSISDSPSPPPPLFSEEKAFGEKEKGKEYRIVSTNEDHYLILYFPYPIDDFDKYTKTPSYFSHLIGHESEGSLLSFFIRSGWATGLSSGSKDYIDFSLFEVKITLTNEGLQKREEMTKRIFEYIHLIKTTKRGEELYDELKKMREIRFDYRDSLDPTREIVSLAENFDEYPNEEDIMYGGYKYSAYSQPEVDHFLSFLSPRNLLTLVISKTFEGKTDEVEKWYQIHYSQSPFPLPLYSYWEEIKEENIPVDIHLPPPNLLIPERFDIVGEMAEVKAKPKLMIEEEKMEIWFKRDDTFLLPFACAFFSFTLPLTMSSPLSFVTMRLWRNIFDCQLNEYSYQSSLFDFNYSASVSSNGLTVSFRGYRDKLGEFIEKIFKELTSFSILPRIFDLEKEDMIREYKNAGVKTPGSLASDLLYDLILRSVFPDHLLLSALLQIKREDVEEYQKRIFEEIKVRALVNGNVNEEDVKKYHDILSQCFPQSRPVSRSSFLSSRQQILRLSPQKVIIAQTKHEDEKNENKAIIVYWQIDNLIDDKKILTAKILSSIISEPSFSYLRTKLQLGYAVSSYIERNANVFAFCIKIQSKKFEPNELYERIIDFSHKFAVDLENFSEEVIKNYINSFVNKLVGGHFTLSDETSLFWSDLLSLKHSFLLPKDFVPIVEEITKEEIISFYKEYIEVAPQLVVQVYEKKEELPKPMTGSDNEILVTRENMSSVKNTLKYFPFFPSPEFENEFTSS